MPSREAAFDLAIRAGSLFDDEDDDAALGQEAGSLRASDRASDDGDDGDAFAEG